MTRIPSSILSEPDQRDFSGDTNGLQMAIRADSTQIQFQTEVMKLLVTLPLKNVICWSVKEILTGNDTLITANANSRFSTHSSNNFIRLTI